MSLDAVDEKERAEAKRLFVSMIEFYHTTIHLPEDDEAPLSSIRNVKFNAELVPGGRPSFRMPSRAPPAARERTMWHTQNAVDQGRWEGVVCSPWGAPAFTVDKTGCPEGRQVVDYREVNKVLRRYRFSIPHMWDILARVSGAFFLSLLDAKSGFRQVEYTEEARRIFTVTTWEGLFRPLRLEMGPANGPEAFQCLMHIIFAALLFKSLCIFIDDFCAFTHLIRKSQRSAVGDVVSEQARAVVPADLQVLVWNCNGLARRLKDSPEGLARKFAPFHLIFLSEPRMSGSKAEKVLTWLRELGFNSVYSEGEVRGQAGVLLAYREAVVEYVDSVVLMPGRLVLSNIKRV
jgi:hypothetical protein